MGMQLDLPMDARLMMSMRVIVTLLKLMTIPMALDVPVRDPCVCQLDVTLERMMDGPFHWTQLKTH